MNREDIKVGNKIRFTPHGESRNPYEILSVDGINLSIREEGVVRAGTYQMHDNFLHMWTLVHKPLSINDIVLNETYTDGQFQYRPVYKNTTIVCAYRDTEPFIYTQDDISSWKVYVPPVKVSEYDLVWSKGGLHSKNKIVCEILPVGVKPNARPENILKRETVTYKE